MTSSSKKKRGKQRKAAKNLAAAANNTSGDATPVAGRVPSIPAGYTAINLTSSQLVELVKNGNKSATVALLSDNLSDISFEINGVLPSVLGFLQKCEHDMFAKVMARLGGDLSSPSTWIRLLSRAIKLEPRCSMQIAQNIGPLVRCMCNDTKGLFFKSNKHWKESIVPFVDLITIMIHWYVHASTVEKRNIINTLLQYEGLLRSVVQWGFWEDAYRPDIVKELGAEDCTHIAVDVGRRIAAALVLHEGNLIGESSGEEDAKGRLEAICTTPIVSKDYDPNCRVSYVAGMIRMAKASGDKIYFSVVKCCTSRIDCVDKGVITEVIDFGFNFTNDVDTAAFVARISSDMLFRVIDDKCQQSDTGTAFAIRSGLIEMCLSLIERFVEHESFAHGRDCDETSLFKYIQCTIEIVHSISLHTKAAKAIRCKRNYIEEKLMQLGQNTKISNNDKCKELLDMVRAILDINGAYCCRLSLHQIT